MQLSPGVKIRDYEAVRLIGSGGMGEVWLARDDMLDREVAIKRLNNLLTQDADFAARFQSEARIQAKLKHPNIVGILAFFAEAGDYYMVLEYAPGITLRELIDRTGPVPEQRALRIFDQIAAALASAHAKGIIHRDVKPSNIMVDPANADHVLMMDFGIARLLSEGHLTRTGTRLGTMHYMSPEQVLAVKDIDARSDVYSAGVVLYEMLSGRLPFNADTDSEYVIQHKIVTEEIPDPRAVYPHISDAAVALLRSCTIKDRNLRPPGFGENAVAPIPQTSVPLQVLPPLSPASTIPIPKQFENLHTNLVLIEGGTFMMGSEQGNTDEKPVHAVTLSPYYICMYQVTQAEWIKIMGVSPSRFRGHDLPVDSVSWNDAVEFCNRLSVQSGLRPCYRTLREGGSLRSQIIEADWSANGFRLPTEAELEYAARGGKYGRGFQFSGSDQVDAVAWYSGNSGGQPHPVGSKQANELGLFDMSGNVWEWCWDWYDSAYYAISPGRDPRGTGQGSYRVLRGGCWYDYATVCRVANRNGYNPFSSYYGLGFRLCRAMN